MNEITKGLKAFKESKSFGNYEIKVKVDKKRNTILYFHDFKLAIKTKDGRFFYRAMNSHSIKYVIHRIISEISNKHYSNRNRSIDNCEIKLNSWFEIIDLSPFMIIHYENPLAS